MFQWSDGQREGHKFLCQSELVISTVYLEKTQVSRRPGVGVERTQQLTSLMDRVGAFVFHCHKPLGSFA